MKRIHLELGGASTEVRVGRGLLERAPRVLGGLGLGRTVLVVTDRRVGRLYGTALVERLRRAGARVQPIFVAAGDACKTLDEARRLYARLLSLRMSRDDVVLGLGGGAVCDLAGYVASTFLRGLRLILVPTTLVAQVDAAVGGKTGVNLPGGKNLVGTFYPASFVLVDPAPLATLDARLLVAGMAEVLKYGLIRDAAFFRRCCRRLPDGAAAEGLLAACIEHKKAVVEADFREAGARRVLNLGHTLGHALETACGHKGVLHGEAVALGTVWAFEVARRLDRIGEGDVRTVFEAFRRCGLCASLPSIAFGRLERIMGVDKKRAGRRLRLVLPRKVGEVDVVDAPRPSVMGAAYADLIARVGEARGGATPPGLADRPDAAPRAGAARSGRSSSSRSRR